jgi:uncharacterized membrane protein (DUF106 family)
MKRVLVALLLTAAVVAMVAVAVSAQSNDRLANLVRGLDDAVVSLRRDGSVSLSRIEELYRESIAPDLENVDNDLNQRILEKFSLLSNPSEENIFSLRRDIMEAGGKLGMSISIVHANSAVFIALLTFTLSLLVTLVNRWVVNWELVSSYQAQVSEFWNEYRDAVRKQDRKRMAKLDQRRQEISRMQAVIMSETMKPSIYYLVPLMILWIVLAKAFSGWVVAWLPFTVSLPVYGKWVACGFGWWYFLTFMVFSVVLRQILVPSIQPAKPQQTEVKA